MFGSDDGLDWRFIVTFLTSLATASFGISKFMKSGPAQIVRNDKCLMGFCTLSFILIYLNVAVTVIGKSLVLAAYVGDLQLRFEEGFITNRNLYISLGFIAFIPQFVHVSPNS